MIRQANRWPTNWARSSTRYKRNLADGDEAANVVDFALQPTGVVAGDLRVDEHALVDFVPVAQFDGHAGQGQIVKALFGVEPLDNDFDRVARLGRRLEGTGGQAALLATAELDEDFVAPQGDDAAAMPRFRLQAVFLAAAFAAGHQVVQRQAAHGAIQFGFHGGRELLPAAGNHGCVVFMRRQADA